MLLYQPSPSEIASALARAVTNFPHIARDRRVDRAAVLLGSVHNWIVWTDTETIWRIPSCSDPTAYWRLEANRCDCPDWHAKTVLVDGMPLCKHSLALRAYRYIILACLTAHLAEDGIRLQPIGFGKFLAYRDAAEFRVWRQFDPATGRSRGPYRFKTDYDLSLCRPTARRDRPGVPPAHRRLLRQGHPIHRPAAHPATGALWARLAINRAVPVGSPLGAGRPPTHRRLHPCHPSKTSGPTAGSNPPSCSTDPCASPSKP